MKLSKSEKLMIKNRRKELKLTYKEMIATQAALDSKARKPYKERKGVIPFIILRNRK